MPRFLLEIGTEELPAGYIEPALRQMAQAFRSALAEARLACGEARTMATPRRLVLWLSEVPPRQEDLEVEVSGPPVRAAFDEQGKPTKAAVGFARSQGVPVEALIRVRTPRGEYCAVRKVETGRPTTDILAELVPRVVNGISFPKSMTWPESGAATFARPVRWLVALLGEELVATEIYGVRAGRASEGHPFLAPGAVEVRDADVDRYTEALREARVMVDTEERRKLIRGEIEAALIPFGGKLEEEWLLDEVVHLVQFPKVVVGRFAAEFLSVPAPVIVAAMTEHQRYFPVRDGRGALCPHFLVVTDRGPAGEDTVRHGNERVLRARLSDARFFYEQDRARRLEDFVADTASTVFLKGLGSYRDKTARLARLVGDVCGALGYGEEVQRTAVRSAELCKADLVTAMVGEFPKLQGIMGQIYAEADGEPPGVGRAIAEHYMPRSASGELPSSQAGRVLSLAEKLDNLCACFSIGLVPSGSADPYALRRQGQAILRIVQEAGRFFRLGGLVRAALDCLPDRADASDQTQARIVAFLQDRLQQLALDQNVPHDLVRAALAVEPDGVVDFWLRLNTLAGLSRDAVWPGLVEVAERTCNISRAAPADGEVDPALFQCDEERPLWDLFRTNRDSILRLAAARRYRQLCLEYAAAFAGPVHEFFEKVFVNVEDSAVRNNRLRLLRDIHRLFGGRVADLSEITTGIQKR